MAWISGGTYNATRGQTRDIQLSDSALGFALYFTGFGSSDKQAIRHYADLHIRLGQVDAAVEIPIEFAYRRLWYPMTYIDLGVYIGGNMVVLPSAQLRVREQVNAIYQLWQFLT